MATAFLYFPFAIRSRGIACSCAWRALMFPIESSPSVVLSNPVRPLLRPVGKVIVRILLNNVKCFFSTVLLLLRLLSRAGSFAVDGQHFASGLIPMEPAGRLAPAGGRGPAAVLRE